MWLYGGMQQKLLTAAPRALLKTAKAGQGTYKNDHPGEASRYSLQASCPLFPPFCHELCICLPQNVSLLYKI